jgi:ElaB/YqjD/DUF883 family membrane-anchored ribosome-binding protein
LGKTRSTKAILLSVTSYPACAPNLSVTLRDPVHPAVITEENTMQTSANQPEFQAAADQAIEELNHIVAQAERLLEQLGEQTGEAAEAVRERVTQTLNQAKAKLAATAGEVEEVAETMMDRTDKYVRANPWQSVAIAALLGSAVTLLVTRLSRK